MQETTLEIIITIVTICSAAVQQCQMSNMCLSLPDYNLSLPVWAVIPHILGTGTWVHGINASYVPMAMALLGMLVVEGGWPAAPEKGVSEENIKYHIKVICIDKQVQCLP